MFEKEEMLQVIKIEILVESKESGSIRDIYLRFLLENGQLFLMSNIPPDIAFELSISLEGNKHQDSRHRLSSLINELALVKSVIIDAVVPMSSTYQATVELLLDGTNNLQRYHLIPSHATLLAVQAKADIFVSKNLVESISDT